MSGPRLRYHFHPTEPLRLGHARQALFGTLWVRSMGGKLVASNENRSALEDLEWLGIEPDAMVSRPKAERYEQASAQLVENGHAYPCFCGISESREMELQQDAWPEERRYDGRCRGLSTKDQNTLKRSRSPSFRLRPTDNLPTISLLGGEQSNLKVDFDFLIYGSQAPQNQLLTRVVDESNARCTHAIVSSAELANLNLYAQISEALENEIPTFLILPPWDCEAAQIPVHDLRNQGFLPEALLKSLASTTWNPGEQGQIEALVNQFAVTDLASFADGLETHDDLRSANGTFIQNMDEERLIKELVSHLTVRGFPIVERDRAWQERFTHTIKSDLMTLGDAELLASHLLQDPSKFDRSSLRRIPAEQLNELLNQFESLMDGISEDSSASWRQVIQQFRQDVPSPGRALSHIRVILTGQPRGPSFASVLWLLGADECRDRLAKARNLHH